MDSKKKINAAKKLTAVLTTQLGYNKMHLVGHISFISYENERKMADKMHVILS